MRLDPETVAAVTGGRLHPGGAPAPAERVVIDSRTSGRGDLFVAIEGIRHDGHRFVGDAVERGAVGVVARTAPTVDRGPAWWIEVRDTLDALQALARASRGAFRGPVIAVTGSNGKTTTKELLASALRDEEVQGSVVASPASYNNHIGVPLTLMAIRSETRHVVLEIGSSGPGEVRALARLSRPDVAIVTTVAESHLAGLGSVEGVLAEKGSLIESLEGRGTAVLDRDLEHHGRFRALHPGRIVTFGRHPESTYRMTRVRATAQDLSVRIAEGDGSAETYRVGLLGRHNARNVAAAVAVARLFGVPSDAIRRRLEGFRPPPMRMEPIRMGGILVVNDAYNANPGSMRAAIRSFRDVAPAGRRRVAVLGEMLELGERSQGLHRELGRFAARAGLDLVVGVGPEMRGAIDAVRREGIGEDRARWFEDLGGFEEELASIVRPGDCMLLKGSRGAALERCLPGIRRIGEDSAGMERTEVRAEGVLSALVQGR